MVEAKKISEPCYARTSHRACGALPHLHLCLHCRDGGTIAPMMAAAAAVLRGTHHVEEDLIQALDFDLPPVVQDIGLAQ